jgi:predicted transcriptional regulator
VMPLAEGLSRPDLYVVARFLEHLWRDERTRRKTDLQLAVRLNYNVYKKYLEWLLEKGLVKTERDGEGERVSITPKGLETYHTLVAWIKDTIGDEHL